MPTGTCPATVIRTIGVLRLQGNEGLCGHASVIAVTTRTRVSDPECREAFYGSYI